MHPILRRPRAVRAALAVLTLGLVATGCSGEPEPVDEGSYSSLQAGAPAALESAGLELLAPTLPPGVDTDAVESALAATDLPEPTVSALADGDADADGLAFDPTQVAGLLATVGNQALATAGDEQYVVLVFDDADSAVVFASAAPAVLADEDADAEATGYVAGSLVGYYAPADGVDETTTFAGVLGDLAAVPAADETDVSTAPTP